VSRLGWLGPSVVGVGLVIGGVGAWYIAHAAPVAGDVVDTIAIDGDSTSRRAPQGGPKQVVVRAEAGGDRAFLELHVGDELRWQALIPHYAGSVGRPGIAWGHDVVTVRVERGGEQEVWALGMADSVKVASLRLATEHEPIAPQRGEPLTLTDHERSYEIVAGVGWHQVVAIDLATGQGVWKRELGAERIEAAKLDGGVLELSAGRVVRLDAATGRVLP
jgi:hypothetical protein